MMIDDALNTRPRPGIQPIHKPSAKGPKTRPDDMTMDFKHNMRDLGAHLIKPKGPSRAVDPKAGGSSPVVHLTEP